MKSVEIQRVYWCRQGTSDKVWGWFHHEKLGYFTLWGPRGKTLRFKRWSTNDFYPEDQLIELSYKKEAKGYKLVFDSRLSNGKRHYGPLPDQEKPDTSMIEEIMPGFMEQLENKIMIDILTLEPDEIF